MVQICPPPLQGWLTNGVPTSANDRMIVTHLSMPNTIEFYMSQEWRVLRERQRFQAMKLQQVCLLKCCFQMCFKHKLIFPISDPRRLMVLNKPVKIFICLNRSWLQQVVMKFSTLLDVDRRYEEAAPQFFPSVFRTRVIRRIVSFVWFSDTSSWGEEARGRVPHSVSGCHSTQAGPGTMGGAS